MATIKSVRNATRRKLTSGTEKTLKNALNTKRLTGKPTRKKSQNTIGIGINEKGDKIKGIKYYGEN